MSHRPFPSLLALGSITTLAAACGGGTVTDDAAVAPDTGTAIIDTGVALDAFSEDAAASDDAHSVLDARPTPDAVVVHPDAFASVDATAPTMPVYSYVVSVVAADPVTDGRVAGINVDMFDSGRGGRVGTCEERRPDFVSSITALPGVDNQISNSLLSTLTSMGVDINMNLEEAIAGGQFLLLVTIEDIDDFVEDPDGVTVTIGMGMMASGDPPRIDPGTGLIAAGQAFRRTMMLGSAPAVLTGNRVIVGVDRIPLPLVLGGTVTTDLRNAQLTARVSSTELFDGEGGGGVLVDDLVEFAAMNGFGDIARSLLPMFADLDPSESDPTDCLSISAGFRLEAVSATVIP